MTTEIKRAFRFALDVGPTEIVILQRYATASRCAFNFAHAFFLAADQMWQRGRDALIAAGMNRSEANAKAPKVKRPGRGRAQAFWRETRGQQFVGPLCEGAERRAAFAWWEMVHNRAYYTAFEDAAVAWQNHMNSRSGRRAGAMMGKPRFKAQGRCRESFRVVHDVKNPSIRFTSPPGCGSPVAGASPPSLSGCTRRRPG
ncbi:hypothetical protein ABT083_17135 [Streptomyces goshikiensis]|uniref:hypothetical protein n=1 Tax=Streptomyces goshikiensis TaxID=1942 RepID=UPI0033284F81